MTDLMMAYYADDLTGSTDALEVLSRAGARTALFLKPPSAETLLRYPDLQAIGVAGRTRSLTPEAIETELSAAFDTFVQLKPRHIHYKVCSTFDSSPERGSIGRALDVGRRVVSSRYVPLLVAAPALGRYCVFGNLYAAGQIGSAQEVFRLDQHPSASQHPSTPMTESDLRVHLAKQTDATIEKFNVLQFALPQAEQCAVLDELIAGGAEVILFDALDDAHLQQLGLILDQDVTDGKSQFSVGSSGIESALGLHWQQTGQLTPRDLWPDPKPVDQVLVVSGSCSPVTHSQIEWAKRSGFAEVALDTSQLVAEENQAAEIKASVEELLRQFRAGKSVVVHTSLGIQDPRVSATQEKFGEMNPSVSQPYESTARLLGAALGRMIRQVLDESSLERLCIAGGDTASWVSQELEIEALEMTRPLTLGAPLCQVHAPAVSTDGLEVVFKGGQVGDEDFFGSLLTGTAA